MTEPGKKSPYEWLEAAESLWRPRLESAGLAVEVASSVKHTHKAARAFGMIYGSDPQRGRRALQAFPGALVVAFTGVATDVYAGGTFWPGFWDTCVFKGSQQEQSEWGDAFLRSLKVLGLPEFQNLPKRYLGPILLHAGIPTYCLADYLYVLEVGMRRVGADASALVTWAVPRLDTTFPNVDMPVRRFLQYGGDYAVDFVDQSLDALITLTGDPDSVVSSAIPERVVDAARQFLAEDRSRGRSIKQSGSRTKPKVSVALSPYAGEIELRIPGLEDFDDDLVWEIRADGLLARVKPRMVAGGRRVSILDSTWRIDMPTRRISVSASGLDEAMEFTLIDERDPILFFQENGEFLPPHMSLPPESVWVLYALPQGTAEPHFLSHILRTEMPPMGWTGWHLALVDLTEVSSIRLSTSHPAHAVRTQSRATLSSDSEVGWITARSLPVHTSRPRLHLPDNISADWRIRIRDLDSSKTLIDRKVSSHADRHDEMDPFGEFPSPLVGRFEISVKGPFGRGLVRNIALVEGLEIDPSNPWRAMVPTGLQTIELSFGGINLTADPQLVTLGPQDQAGRVSFGHDDSGVDAVVSPPSMAVATLREGVASRWSSGLVRVPLEECHEVTLLVRIQPDISPSLLEVRSGNDVVQLVEPSANSGLGYATYALQDVSDTARTLRTCDLYIQESTSTVRIARIEPKLIASGATAKDGAIVLEDFSGGDVMVKVWSLYQPWVPPILEVVSAQGEVRLSPELNESSPFVVTWQRYDPWVPSEWPWMPEGSTSRVVDSESDREPPVLSIGFVQDGVVEDALLSLPEAWALTGMSRAHPNRFHWPTMMAMGDAIRRSPREGLVSLLDIPTTSRHRLELLIQSGLIWSRQDSTVINGESIEDPVRLLGQDAVIGLLSTLDVLPRIGDTEAGSEYWRLLRDTYGEEMISILTSVGDPACKAGTFATARWFAGQQEVEQNRIIDLLRLVPKGFLDADSRTAAALELFQAREQSGAVSAARYGRHRLREIEAILRDWHWEAALQLLAARGDIEGRGGWPTLSAQSAGFALLARLAARGDHFAGEHLEKFFPDWLALVEAAPSLVAIDIVLAEAMAVAEFSTDPLISPFSDSDLEAEDDDV